jgi:hypothetical protein
MADMQRAFEEVVYAPPKSLTRLSERPVTSIADENGGARDQRLY